MHINIILFCGISTLIPNSTFSCFVMNSASQKVVVLILLLFFFIPDQRKHAFKN
jgi:hypothetical protein